jgi:hypothetical protein
MNVARLFSLHNGYYRDLAGVNGVNRGLIELPEKGLTPQVPPSMGRAAVNLYGYGVPSYFVALSRPNIRGSYFSTLSGRIRVIFGGQAGDRYSRSVCWLAWGVGAVRALVTAWHGSHDSGSTPGVSDLAPYVSFPFAECDVR